MQGTLCQMKQTKNSFFLHETQNLLEFLPVDQILDTISENQVKAITFSDHCSNQNRIEFHLEEIIWNTITPQSQYMLQPLNKATPVRVLPLGNKISIIFFQY